MNLTEIASSQPQRESLKLMTLEYTNVSEGNFVEEPVVELFCRNNAGERRQINVHDYYPHFYISESEFIEYKDVLLQEPKIRSMAVDERIVSDVDGMNAAIDPVDGAPRTTLEGTDLVKVYTVTPGDVSDLREGFDQHWEADVFFTNRFLVDSGIKLGISVPEGKTDVSFDEIEVLDDGEEPDIRPRLLTVDIEVWSGGEFPDTTDPDKPVTAITAHDSYDDEYFCGILHPDSVRQGSAHTWDDDIEWCAPDGLPDNDLVVNVYHDEVELLAAFNEFVMEKDPDLLTGWNSSRNDMGSGFDYPYLINRCDRLNEWTVQELSYDNGATFVTSRGRANIAGREMFDMLQAYKKTQIHEKRSYALGYIADQELGYGKEDIDGLDEGWLHNPVEFMRYNIRDTQAVIEIEEAKSVLEMYDHIRSITGTTYSEIADSNIGIIDVLFLRQAKERGYALPTSEEPETQHYWGAYVFDPSPGKHRNVVYPDLSSLYPNLFRDMNASPETIIGDESDLRDSSYSKDDCQTIYVDERSEAAKKAADEPVRSERYVLKPDVKESFVRDVISDLIDMKYEYKSDEYPDEAYAAAKRITNSCFTPDTEVMTPDGIKKITDVEVGDDVYSWNPDTGEMQVKPVTETIEKPEYDGEIIHIENNKIDLKVTPDHRMAVKRPRYSDEWEVTDAGDLNEWTHYETPNRWQMEHGSGINNVDLDRFTDSSFTVTTDYITAGSQHNNFNRYVDGDAFIDLVGWFITEGSVYISDDTESRGDSLHISQYQSVNQDVYAEIEETVNKLELTHSSGKRAIEVCGSVYPNILRNICGSGSENKQIPSFIFEEASLEQKERLLEVLMMGDGDKRECTNRYSTKSKQLRDDVITLLWEIGHKPTYRYDDSGEHNTGVWRINYTTDDSGDQSKQSFRMHRDGSRENAENGVYCIQVEDNHTLVAGRNGKFTNILNCYGVIGDSVSYGKGFRLFDWRIAEAITLAGRDVIKHTADEFVDRVKSMGYADAEIIAGDTDSCVCEVPSADGLEETLEVAQEAAEYVDMTYDDFMHNRFGIEDGNMAVEIESYAETALFMEKKKRYAQRVRWDEGEYVDSVEYKGFELVRSDSAEITGDVQRGVIDRILKEDDPKSAVSTYLRNEWSAVLDGEIDHDQLGIPSAINNELGDYGWTVNKLDEDDVPLERDGEELEEGDEVVKYYTSQPNIRGARYANSHIEGEDISQGDKPLMFYVKRVDPTKESYPEVYEYDHRISLNAPRSKPDMNEREMKELERPVDAIAVNDVRNLDGHIRIDYEKMANRTIRKTVEPIVQVMGWSFDDLTTVGEQSGLDAYM